MIDTHANLRQTRLILIGAALLLSLGMGIRQSFGLFLTPVTRELALTAADFTLAVAVQNIVWGISQAPVGAIADRFGLRVTMVAGAAIYVVGLAVMAAAAGVAALIVSGVLIGVALSCIASSLAMTAAARAVSEQRRSQTLGLVAAAGSLGTLVIPLMRRLYWLIKAGGSARYSSLFSRLQCCRRRSAPVAPTGCWAAA